MPCIEFSGHHKWVSSSPSDILHKIPKCFSFCIGSHVDCKNVNTVGNSHSEGVKLIMDVSSNTFRSRILWDEYRHSFCRSTWARHFVCAYRFVWTIQYMTGTQSCFSDNSADSFVPLIMPLISSSLLASPFTFHNAIFIGVWPFSVLYRDNYPAVWRSGPDTIPMLLGSDTLPRTVSSGEAPQPRTF